VLEHLDCTPEEKQVQLTLSTLACLKEVRLKQ